MSALLLVCALSGPPQVTLPSCPCKPCHCQSECHCSGGLCSCFGCGLTLEEGAALAARRNLPLVVWVNHTHASVAKRLPPAVHVRVRDWKGSKAPGVVVCPLHGGWPHARKLIGARQADLATVLEELAGDWLREVRARPAPRTYFAPPRAVSC